MCEVFTGYEMQDIRIASVIEGDSVDLYAFWFHCLFDQRFSGVCTPNMVI